MLNFQNESISSQEPKNPPKIQTATKSPTRNSTMSGISAPHHRFTCQLCSFSTNTKRDYTRHLATRKHRNHANIGLAGMDERAIDFLCPVPDCKYSPSAATGGEMMFSREDNFWRHIRKVHKIKKQQR
ncbi:hypothetical protein B0T13DRAFT_456734 [Neurospora crassa]|nr:hypothetical protein B0T13DRAFT_456734 [Neurospora crassa]